jgi:hypothetical protein
MQIGRMTIGISVLERMRFAWCITKVKNTSTQNIKYLLLSAANMVKKRVSTLRYKFIGCFVKYNYKAPCSSRESNPRLLGGSMNIKTMCLEHSHIILWKSDIKDSDIDIKDIGLNAKKDKAFLLTKMQTGKNLSVWIRNSCLFYI